MSDRPTPNEVTLAEAVITAAGGTALTQEQTLRVRFAALDSATELAMERIKSGNYSDKSTDASAVARAAVKFEKFLLGHPNTEESSNE